jgi:hypothetical protein
MKPQKLIPALLFIIALTESSFSIDTVSTKYLPLKVGNVWVYDYTGVPNSGKMRMKITGTVVSNGHVYYIFELTGSSCDCGQNTQSPFLVQLQPLRIDSVNGNLMMLGTSSLCPWQSSEHLVDSLRRRTSDTLHNYCNATLCYDTSQQMIFGVSRSTKKMGVGYVMTYDYSRRYAKDIGLISSGQGCIYNFQCNYTLAGAIVNGVLYGDTSFPTGIITRGSEIPSYFELCQNYPNPFNPSTRIKFSVPEPCALKLVIYDAAGREIETLVDEVLRAGTYEVNFNGDDLSSGIYYYNLITDAFTQSKKMVLLK